MNHFFELSIGRHVVSGFTVVLRTVWIAVLCTMHGIVYSQIPGPYAPAMESVSTDIDKLTEIGSRDCVIYTLILDAPRGEDSERKMEVVSESLNTVVEHFHSKVANNSTSVSLQMQLLDAVKKTITPLYLVSSSRSLLKIPRKEERDMLEENSDYLFTLGVAQKEVVQYFEALGENKFELKELQANLGLTIRMATNNAFPRGDSRHPIVVFEKVVYEATALEKRQPLAGVELEVGIPVISTTKVETSIEMEAFKFSWIELPVPRRDGSTIYVLYGIIAYGDGIDSK